jgi:hypothetical protein
MAWSTSDLDGGDSNLTIPNYLLCQIFLHDIAVAKIDVDKAENEPSEIC